ncbi:hypothetical protein [Liquorilactobacillus vini]|uniref:Uncharacterized protein n=1 Tax=Liquorilactobacillus vini DSM 20605 TaxID=1133569 RepID=A0A0R2C4J9_9LACO|nr:hypothetical protein [Liquorilactobacillus vini]KRM86653.1 hypothetical protein FD21_GL001473 [Liquorilactobacillus vini DSM 20605]
MIIKPSNTCAVVIVHGKSEYCIVEHIKSKMRLPIEIYGKKNGQKSIQIEALPNILNNEVFRSKKSLQNKYPAIDFKKDFKIFTVMDIDDVHDNSVKTNYIDGKISNISNGWQKKFLYPIYFKENLEDVLKDAHIWYALTDNDKRSYIKVFPVEHNGEISYEDRKDIEEFEAKMEKSKKTNFDRLLKYCISHAPKFKKNNKYY